MPMGETARVAVVTGGGRGIGRGIALALADLGLAVVVNYRSDADSAEATCAEARRRGAAEARAIRADVSDLADGRRLLDEAMAVAGRIDLWVNNAGVAPERRLDMLETTPESWDRVLATNLRGPFFLSQAVGREMLRLRSDGIVADPQLVFITSISSRFASVNRAEYCVAKAGLSMVVQLFAARLAGAGIRVYEVRPGLIDTDMTRAVRAAYDERIAGGLVPMGRWGTAEDVGRAVAAIAAGNLPYSTGAVIDVDGGLGLRIF
jgi:NAD(P)-dependent dehydrogenase (short-subunit alcohol dehydrogenase family)